MKTVYEVIMFEESCPCETSSLGLYETEELATADIEKEKHNYDEDMIFEIEPKYLWN
jgi:hypothetical protein